MAAAQTHHPIPHARPGPVHGFITRSLRVPLAASAWFHHPQFTSAPGCLTAQEAAWWAGGGSGGRPKQTSPEPDKCADEGNIPAWCWARHHGKCCLFRYEAALPPDAQQHPGPDKSPCSHTMGESEGLGMAQWLWDCALHGAKLCNCEPRLQSTEPRIALYDSELVPTIGIGGMSPIGILAQPAATPLNPSDYYTVTSASAI